MSGIHNLDLELGIRLVLDLQDLFNSITLALVYQSQQCKTEPHLWILQILHFNWCIGIFSLQFLTSLLYMYMYTSILCNWCWWQLLIEIDKCFIFKILKFVSLTTQSKDQKPKFFYFKFLSCFRNKQLWKIILLKSKTQFVGKSHETWMLKTCPYTANVQSGSNFVQFTKKDKI